MTCSCCKRDDLQIGDFHKDKRTGIHSHCKTCRRRKYLLKRYKKICAACGEPMPDNGDTACRECRTKQGLRRCNQCSLLLPSQEFFYGREPYCKDCR